MSYDLSIRPRDAGRSVTAEAATAALEAAGARAATDEGPAFTFGDAELDLEQSHDRVEAINVSSPATTEPPDALYRLVSQVASELGWSVYDPQGDAWLEPRQVGSAAKESWWPLEPDVVCWLLMLVGAAIGGVAWFMSERSGRSDLLLVLMWAGLTLLIGGRAGLYLIKRRPR